MWTDADDQIIGGDLTAALAYVTPAGGAVLTPIAPIGLRDREAGTVSFTTSLGFGRKLDRIKANPKVSLAYHAREHGFATGPAFVLVQGTASYDATPDIDVLTNEIGPASVKFMGDRATGPFWDRWLSAYYADRVVVTVAVTRVVTWPDHACSGEPTVSGEPLADRRTRAPGAAQERHRSADRRRQGRGAAWPSCRTCWPATRAPTASRTSSRSSRARAGRQASS